MRRVEDSYPDARTPPSPGWWVFVGALLLGVVIGFTASRSIGDDEDERSTRAAVVQGVTRSGDAVALTWDDGSTGSLQIVPDLTTGTGILSPGMAIVATYLEIDGHGTVLLDAVPRQTGDQG
jgi:hypothetical protein